MPGTGHCLVKFLMGDPPVEGWMVCRLETGMVLVHDVDVGVGR